MNAQRLNRASGKAMIVLSFIALITVLAGYLQPPQPPPPDEGTGAHVFQLSIAALLPAILIFLATADWKQPWRSARPLVIPAVALILAFGGLYCLEHYRWVGPPH